MPLSLFTDLTEQLLKHNTGCGRPPGPPGSFELFECARPPADVRTLDTDRLNAINGRCFDLRMNGYVATVRPVRHMDL
jgi:hypothetical protein